MKIRRSARTILATLLLLSIFTSLTVWHNKAPGRLSAQEIQLLIQELSFYNPKLILFLNATKEWSESRSFYATVNSGQTSWPVELSRACYPDPFAAWSMRSILNITGSGKIVLFRYRSMEDFLLILKRTETKKPGTMKTLNFRQYKSIQEPPFIISLRLLVSILVGTSGLMLVRFYNR
jgi:hypothetical protein